MEYLFNFIKTPSTRIQKVNYEDVKLCINNSNYLLINTLPAYEQTPHQLACVDAGKDLPIQEATGGKFLDNCRTSMRASAGVGFVIGFPIGRLEINYIGWARRFAGEQGGDARRWKWGISSEFL